MQQSLLEKLRNAAFDDDTRITDFAYLVDAADIGRDKTIATLHDLKQRLLNAELAQNEGEAGVETLQSSTPPVTSPTAAVLELPTRTRTNSSLSAHKTWTRDYSYPRDASGEEDAASGVEAENSRTRNRKRSSLLSFLKPHSRTYSASEKEMVSHAPVSVVQQAQIQQESPSSSRTSQSHEHRRQLSSAPPSSVANAVVLRSPQLPPPPKNEPHFTYEEWEDNPQEIWGPFTTIAARPAERRETAQIAPDGPPSPILTHRTNSGPVSHLQPSSTIATPNPDNDYLGFCKSASRLQNADRKALTKTREVEAWSRHPTPSANALHFLSCATKGCNFRSTIVHRDTELIWNKMLPEWRGVRARWKFLAKSHVPMRRAGTQASYQCLFCVFQQGTSGVFQGAELYLGHVADQHRGTTLGDVVLYKTGCVNDRVCAEDELEWDINIYPSSSARPHGGMVKIPGLSADVVAQQSMPFNPEDYVFNGRTAKLEDNKYDSVLGANEPWNEGLSDFHYRGELDRTELE